MTRQKVSVEQVEAFRGVVEALVPADAKYVVRQVWYPYDHDEEAQYAKKKLGRKSLVKAAVSAYAATEAEDAESIGTPKDLAGVLTWVEAAYEETCDRYSLVTLKQHRQEEEERERKACEGLAARICGKYNVKANSLAFISAVHRHYGEIERSERHFRTDPEMRMERWGRASMNGNSQGFWEDNDYSSSLENRAQEDRERLLRYCHRYLPLLMARWQERQERRRQDK